MFFFLEKNNIVFSSCCLSAVKLYYLVGRFNREFLDQGKLEVNSGFGRIFYSGILISFTKTFTTAPYIPNTQLKS